MGVNATLSPIARIGETAGIVWRYLDKADTVPVKKLIQELDVPRDLLMQAIGWLAREDKLVMTIVKRRRTIALKRS